MTMLPRYLHADRCCTYLGSYRDVGEGQTYDLYHCLQGGTSPTVLARFGNDPAEYDSGLPGRTLEYREFLLGYGSGRARLMAEARALARGLDVGR